MSTLGDRVRPLDDDVVADIVGDARVVAIGESNHYIAEFGALRERLVRFLVDELGFSVLAMESGFVEGHLVDAWLRDGDGADETFPAEHGFTFRFGDAPETRSLLRGLRGRGVHFAGIDVAGSGGDPAPALRFVAERGDAAHGPLVDRALAATRTYASPNSGVALERYTALHRATRDAATAALARLVLRLDATGAAADVRHAALGALHLDEHLREFVAITGTDGPDATPAVSSRDVHMADTLRLLLDRHGDGTRVVVLAHNGHLQRRPLVISPHVALHVAGMHLDAALGDDYRVIGVTARGGSTTAADAEPAPGARHGIGVMTVALPRPESGSVEAAVDSDGGPVLADLRGMTGGPTSISGPAGPYAVDVAAAFDAVVVLPTSTPSRLLVD